MKQIKSKNFAIAKFIVITSLIITCWMTIVAYPIVTQRLPFYLKVLCTLSMFYIPLQIYKTITVTKEEVEEIRAIRKKYKNNSN